MGQHLMELLQVVQRRVELLRVVQRAPDGAVAGGAATD